MKITILLILLITNFNAAEGQSKDLNNLTFNELGALTKLPDGPLSGEDLNKVLGEEQDKSNGMFTTKPTVLVQIPDSMKSRKLGKTRISGENLNLVFPEDRQYKSYIEQPEQDKIETMRMDLRKQVIADAEEKYTNPFPQILQIEKSLAITDQIKESNSYTKHLLELAAEREEEMYNKSVENELGEVTERRFNRGLLNPLMKSK
jgi:hypothetical protein